MSDSYSKEISRNKTQKLLHSCSSRVFPQAAQAMGRGRGSGFGGWVGGWFGGWGKKNHNKRMYLQTVVPCIPCFFLNLNWKTTVKRGSTTGNVPTTYNGRSGFTSKQGMQGTTVYRSNTFIYYKFPTFPYILTPPTPPLPISTPPRNCSFFVGAWHCMWYPVHRCFTQWAIVGAWHCM